MHINWAGLDWLSLRGAELNRDSCWQADRSRCSDLGLFSQVFLPIISLSNKEWQWQQYVECPTAYHINPASITMTSTHQHDTYEEFRETFRGEPGGGCGGIIPGIYPFTHVWMMALWQRKLMNLIAAACFGCMWEEIYKPVICHSRPGPWRRCCPGGTRSPGRGQRRRATWVRAWGSQPCGWLAVGSSCSSGPHDRLQALLVENVVG